SHVLNGTNFYNAIPTPKPAVLCIVASKCRKTRAFLAGLATERIQTDVAQRPPRCVYATPAKRECAASVLRPSLDQGNWPTEGFRPPLRQPATPGFCIRPT